MKKIDRVLVVGAGIGGLGAGIAFAQRGAEVEIVEVKPDGAVFGVGINQPANSLRALKELGVLGEILERGFVYDRNSFFDRFGNHIVDTPSRLGDEEIPANCALSRADLASVLRARAESLGVRIARSTTVASFAQDGDGVDVRLSDGRSARYDLMVAFDGIRSQTRRTLFGDAFEPAYTGCGVWRVTVPRPVDVRSCLLYQGEHTKAGVIPLSDDSMYMLLVTREPGNPRYERGDYVDLLRSRLGEHAGLIGEIRDAIPSSAEVVYSPLSEVFIPDRWFDGRVMVAGDAAHVCTPHLTQGASMALEDAVVLAEMLDRDTPVQQSLSGFMSRRLPRVELVQRASRGILDAEMSVTPETYSLALQGMKEHLPEQAGSIDELLNVPA